MIIRLSKHLNVNQFSCLFSGIVGTDRMPTCAQVTLDFTDLIFIEPTGITALSNLIHWLYENNRTVHFTGYSHYSSAINYLDDSKFFERYLGYRINPNAQLRSTTKPLEFIQTTHSLVWLKENLMQWITLNSGKNRNTFLELLVCLQEVFQNIRDHSGTLIGSVYAQYFPGSGKLSISVSDIGVGIPGKINKFLIDQGTANRLIVDKIPSSSAIIKACQEGFTTSSHAGNAGRGLAALVLIITKHYNGKVTIISDNGYVKYSGRHQRVDVTDRDWLYPGCLIDIDLDINHIQNVEDSSEEYMW
ncbi:MAG: hypothetical protein ACXW4B_11445 [Micavibrio sp.]